MTAFEGDLQEELVLRFSHNVLEHLGLKLYQNKPTNVLAELVSNSWDAYANNVWIDISNTSGGAPRLIAVADDGHGMTHTSLRDNYLVVGKPKRDEGEVNKGVREGFAERKPMGRKGIGKLAPFGVARLVSLITVSEGMATWLTFNYEGMLKSEGDYKSFSEYKPDILASSVPLASVDSSLAGEAAKYVESFKRRLGDDGSGTLILAGDLTLRRAILAADLMESLGRRFTVTLCRPDFKVWVNGEELQESHAFPAWYLRIPESGSKTAVVQTPDGSREVSYWVGFVKEASWPQEQAGVGVYAHGKIAQDRAFFFGVKGSEIFSRYMYAVVEADWIDELDYDAISTDRTSINWDDPNFEGFYSWGASSVKDWVKEYQKALKLSAKEEGGKLIDKVVVDKSLYVRPSEKEHLVDLLSEITPRMQGDGESQERLVEATVKAWVHEPARRLIKKLWEEAALFDAEKFSLIMDRLVEQLVPESLSLAVVFSQRVFALTQLEGHIMRGQETQLQYLIEQFPWILDKKYESYIPRRALKTICEEAQQQGIFTARPVHVASPADYTKPDFVFFVDSADTHILVVELKGPDAVASWPEFEQLHSYMTYLQSRDSSKKVRGVLLAREFDPGIQEQKSNAMEYVKWQDVLKLSRRDHMQLLGGLLAGADADPNDIRVRQVCDLGGHSVTGFLAQMAKTSPELDEIVKAVKKS
ncbi:ATP-binding protein [Pseudomonas aeruginosa]|uniref:ATP-binding protein n=1 Tax=Pseudomonas aeruginosa TaxID=287 RepID=UPI002FE6B733